MSQTIKFKLYSFCLVASLLISPRIEGVAQTDSTKKEYRLVVDVDLVSLLVTVSRDDGSLVADLTEDDFRVYEDGEPQKISFFGRQSDQPLQLCLLFDSSISIAPELKTQQDAAIEFVRETLSSKDRVSVIRISEDVEEIIHRTNRIDRVIDSVRSIKPGGGTSLYDAVYLSAGILKESKGRRVILVISDGTDTTSHTQFQECLKQALSSQLVVYSLIVQPIKSEPGRNLGGEHALIYLSERTGGRYFRISLHENLRDSFRTISRDLRTQYILGYYPPTSSPGDYHKVEVRVTNSTHHVRARDGYYRSPR